MQLKVIALELDGHRVTFCETQTVRIGIDGFLSMLIKQTTVLVLAMAEVVHTDEMLTSPFNQFNHTSTW